MEETDNEGPVPFGSITPSKRYRSQFSKPGYAKPDMNKYLLWKQNGPKQRSMELVMMAMFVDCSLPFALFDKQMFRFAMRQLEPCFRARGRQSYAKYTLPLLFENVEKAVADVLEHDLPEAQFVSFTTDFWKSRNKDQYLNITLHYVDPNGELKHFHVEFQGKSFY